MNHDIAELRNNAYSPARAVPTLQRDLADVAATRVGEQAIQLEHYRAVMLNARVALDAGEVGRAKSLLNDALREPLR